MTYNFDRFLRYDEMVSWLHDLQKQFPGLVALETYGKSYKGRDLWIATVTDTSTGAHNTKPAHWIDANIHATEATGSVAALFILDFLASNFGKHDQVTEALSTRTF
jgi:murein tripeptide amidase MpaA